MTRRRFQADCERLPPPVDNHDREHRGDRRRYLLVLCRRTLIALLLHCCCPVVVLLLQFCYTVVTVLLQCCYTVVALLLHCCLKPAKASNLQIKVRNSLGVPTPGTEHNEN
jgi:hypothetical protein